MDRINEWITAHADDLTSAAARLVKINSVGAPAVGDHPYGDGVAAAMDEAVAIAGEWGMATHNHEYHVVTAQIGEGEPKLGILAHLDTVPIGSGWTYPPLGAEIDGGRMYGRGAIDDKGPAAAVLFAMRAIRECGIRLAAPCRCILGGDEETGSTDMEYYQTKEPFPPFVFSPDADYPLINAEKGRVQLTVSADHDDPCLIGAAGGVALNAVPIEAVAQIKGVRPEEIAQVLTDTGYTADIERDADGLRLTVHGVAAHGSTPEKGENAVTALLHILARLGIGGKAVHDLAERFPYGEHDGTHAGAACADRESGALTLSLNCLDIRDGKICARADIRFPVTETVAGVTARLRAGLADAFQVSFSGCAESHCVPADSPFVQTLLRVYEQQTGQKGECMAIGGGTYVHEIENGVAFGAEFPGADNHMHAADESVVVEELIANARIIAHAIIEVCGTVA